MPNSNDTPTVPFDTSIIYQMMRDMRQNLLDDNERTRREVRDLSARVAISQSQVIAMSETMKVIASDAATSRVSRLEQEISEQQREKKVLQERIKMVDERLDEKNVAKDGALSTESKIKVTTARTIEELQQQEEEAQKAIWTERREKIITAVLVWSSIGTVGIVVTFIGFLIKLFMER